MKGFLWFGTCVLILSSLGELCHAQGQIQPRRLIESPTAGLLPKGSFDLDLRIFDRGGILGGVNVGLMDQLMVGGSFGGEQIVGSGKIRWNPKVEISARYRFMEESRRLPGAAVGFDSQGFGPYNDKLKRYAVKSKGLYVVLSKNFTSSLGQFGLHGGLNTTLEDEDGDDDLSGYIGFDKSLGEDLSLMVEYDFATNDGDHSLGSGEGRLNAGLRWQFGGIMAIEFDMKHLTSEGKGSDLSREIGIIYFERF